MIMVDKQWWIILVWWMWIQIMGLAALPLAYRFFRRLPDRGYAFARPLGLLLSSYILWVGASLRLLRNSLGGAIVSLMLVAALSILFYRRRGTGCGSDLEQAEPGLGRWLWTHKALVLSVELLFTGAWVLWSFLRAYSPELTTTGGEKFMEIMYLNSIGRSDYFPPHDAWLSGYAISYYYFGYVMIAMLTRLSGFPAHLTFNVGLALLFALTCTGAFGVVYNLVKGSERAHSRSHSPLLWAFLGAILVAVMGNLEGFLEVLYGRRLLPEPFWRWLDILDINEPFNPALAPSLMPTRSSWWWWRASRVINDLDPLGNSMSIQPIDEFPGFSFLLGDMHPHVLALPFVLLALTLALNVLIEGVERAGEGRPGGGWLRSIRELPWLIPLCLGALGFLNTWDFPIYWIIFLAAYGLGRWARDRRIRWPLVQDIGVTGIAIAVLGVLFYLPFYLGFQSQAGGLLPTLYVGTRFRQYFVMFGPFLVVLAGLLIILAGQLKPKVSRERLFQRWVSWLALFLLVPFALMGLIVLALFLSPQGRELLEGIRQVPAVYALVGDESWGKLLVQLLLVKLRTWVMPLIVAAMAAMGMALLPALLAPYRVTERSNPALQEPRFKGEEVSLCFVLLCAVVGLLLTLSVEYFYLVDNFRVRMNTIFKFYFQAWVLMAVASAFAAYWLSRGGTNRNIGWQRWLRRAFLFGFWLLFAMGMVYPVLANISRAGNFDHAPTLDGTAYLADSQPDDYAAIAWLNAHIDDALIILEAPGTGGSSYVYEGRVSALTGLPTLLGWAGHEGQWRGGYEVQSAREPDIETIYRTLDPLTAQALLDQYSVSYVYVGPLERSKYDPRGLEKFQTFMDVVYQQGAVTIYKTRK